MTLLGVPLSTVLQVSFIVVVLGFVWRLRASRSRLPPGPNPIPIIGNLGLLSNYRPAFKKWADQYGDVMILRIMGIPIIILNSRSAASEILEKRASTTFGRPHQVMADDLVGLGPDPGRTSDPTLHKQYRKLFALALSSREARTFWQAQIHENRQAALDILMTPQNYLRSIKRAVAAIAFLVAYGYQIEDEDDPMVMMGNRNMRIFEQVAQPGKFAADIIPLLRYLPSWLPGAGFKSTASLWNAQYTESREIPFELVKKDLASGKTKPSLSATLLQAENAEGNGRKYHEELVKWVAASIYGGGADTSVAAIHSVLAAMILYPATQAKAHAELDKVIGRERPPTITDRESLPYCWAIVQEVLRWQPVSTVALPHILDQDEEFQGYLLPKGATILPNVWAMSRDERDFPSADDFMPERFLSEDGKSLRTDVPGRSPSLAFGFGRRICPGYHLAEANIFAAVVSILWSSTISRAEGSKIEWLEPLGVHRPKDFPIDVKPRFPGAVEILRASITE